MSSSRGFNVSQENQPVQLTQTNATKPPNDVNDSQAMASYKSELEEYVNN